jgi:phage terminase large subunit-like protein
MSDAGVREAGAKEPGTKTARKRVVRTAASEKISALFTGAPFDIADFCRRMSDADIARAEWDWRRWRTAGQEVPGGDWRTWLVMAGRGFGKTRMGAEWVRELAEAGGSDTRIALVGATIAEVRAVMIEGESGLLSVGPPGKRPIWEPSVGRLTWPNGVQGLVYSAENPEKLRGPSHHFAWCDELAKWGYPQETWDNLQMGLRLGATARAMVTTTPRPIELVRKLFGDVAVAKTFGATTDNAFLPQAFTDWVQDTYAGTRLGRQELDGELIDDVAGALWTRAAIEACRARAMSEARRVVIGVDPPAGVGGDACGIVVVALGGDGVAYVLEDASVSGLAPEGWAAAVAGAAARYKVDRVIAEANNGGSMVESVLLAADAALPVQLVHASQGKSARAEPVAMLYSKGRVRHLGAFPALEDELCGLVQGGGYEGPGRSPDRADALVWAVWALMLGKRVNEPRIRVV